MFKYKLKLIENVDGPRCRLMVHAARWSTRQDAALRRALAGEPQRRCTHSPAFTRRDKQQYVKLRNNHAKKTLWEFPECLRAGQDKTNEDRTSFTVGSADRSLIKHACYAAIYLSAHSHAAKNKAPAQEVASRGAPGVLHHVVTGNYFIALHA